MYSQELYLEVLTCMTLRHDNIARVFGLYDDSEASYILSPWMEHGNIRYHLWKRSYELRRPPEETLELVNTWV